MKPRTALRPPLSLAPLSTLVVASVVLNACGGDDGGEDLPPPPPDPSSIAYAVSDPCGTGYPSPSDLYFDASGKAGLDACPLPSDPLDAAVETVLRDQRAELEPTITLPIEGTLDPASLSTALTVSFDGQGSGDGLPAVLLFEQTGTSSSAEAWRSISVSASAADGTITLRPSRALLPGRLHVVVATSALQDNEAMQPQSLTAGPAVSALLGSSAIGAGAFTGLDADGAARLERMRLALQDPLAALAAASPPVGAADIVSVHAFTTRLGMELIPDAIARYDASVRRGTYRYEIKVEQRDIPPADIYGSSVPASAYPNVASFIRGSVVVPRMLGDDVRLRAEWDTVAETVDVPFLMSIPRQGTSYPVAVQIAGFGRSSLDARSLANVMAGGPRGSVLAIELRCHGRRSPDVNGVCVDNRTAAEAASLLDQASNNGNPEFAASAADGIPDNSGVGYFPGDPRKLRDSQLAAIIEVMHVFASLRDATAWTGENIPVDRFGIHGLAQGYASLPAAAAAGFIDDQRRIRTLQFLAGGADLAELILEGGMAQRAQFNDELPGGIGEAQAATLLARLGDYLAPMPVSRLLYAGICMG
ncbi:MAG: hypothetical protein AAFU79_15405, partial [Myxococcota bacterium]